MKKLKYLALGAGLAGAVLGAQPAEVSAETSLHQVQAKVQVQTGVTTDDDFRTRIISGLDIDIGDYTLSFHGLNQTDNVTGNYFGEQHFSFGDDFRFVYIMETAADRIGHKAGVSMPLFKGGLDATVEAVSNLRGLEGHLILGTDIYYGIDASLFQVGSFSSDKPFYYTELQVKKDLSDDVFAYGRLEAVDFDSPVLVIGIGVDIPE